MFFSPVTLLNQKDFSIPEYGRPGIQLGSLIACLAAKDISYRFHRQRRLVRQHFGGNLPNSLEALNVKGISRSTALPGPELEALLPNPAKGLFVSFVPYSHPY